MQPRIRPEEECFSIAQRHLNGHVEECDGRYVPAQRQHCLGTTRVRAMEPQPASPESDAQESQVHDPEPAKMERPLEPGPGHTALAIL
jgi:hypothetical protein